MRPCVAVAVLDATTVSSYSLSLSLSFLPLFGRVLCSPPSLSLSLIPSLPFIYMVDVIQCKRTRPGKWNEREEREGG